MPPRLAEREQRTGDGGRGGIARERVKPDDDEIRPAPGERVRQSRPLRLAEGDEIRRLDDREPYAAVFRARDGEKFRLVGEGRAEYVHRGSSAAERGRALPRLYARFAFLIEVCELCGKETAYLLVVELLRTGEGEFGDLTEIGDDIREEISPRRALAEDIPAVAQFFDRGYLRVHDPRHFAALLRRPGDRVPTRVAHPSRDGVGVLHYVVDGRDEVEARFQCVRGGGEPSLRHVGQRGEHITLQRLVILLAIALVEIAEDERFAGVLVHERRGVVLVLLVRPAFREQFFHERGVPFEHGRVRAVDISLLCPDYVLITRHLEP